jgi:HSP20 family protein
MLARYNPFNELFRDDFWNVGLRAFANDAEWRSFTPAVDVLDGEKAYVLKVEVPGLKPEDIDIALENNVLTLKGERKLEQESERQGYRRVERRYGSFARAFVLPEGTRGDGIEATVKDGVLSVTIPKAEAPSPRKIAVKTGDLIDKAKQLFTKPKADEAPATPANPS